MIGVIADPADKEVCSEFFELFKTPWEFCETGRPYDVVVCTGGDAVAASAPVVLHYAGRRTESDEKWGIATSSPREGTRLLVYEETSFPIYGGTVSFPESRSGVLTNAESGERFTHLEHRRTGVLVRIGYDLFAQVRTLLTDGQPIAYSGIPSLEVHIALLRDLITGCGIALLEIPPAPEGYPFVVCLTHDVDHPSIRRHPWDHTAFGFLLRALFGSVRDVIRKRISIRDLASNWAAALKLPLIYLGLAKDFWGEFYRAYLGLEDGLPSTYFVIPFEKYPGQTRDGSAPAFRAAGYGAKHISGQIQTLLKAGCEIGLHGIDAWIDKARGQDEAAEIRQLTGAAQLGVRMHWLYYDRESARILERIGVEYDSTVGYNQTVGYRSGTTQVYKPLGATRLLELPLHVMDTALFYPGHLGFSRRQAKEAVARVVTSAAKYGGCITINWHDRSLFPERLWGECYKDLLDELKARGAWFATAGEAVSWFRKRRSTAFKADVTKPGGARVEGCGGSDELPGLRLRIWEGGTCRDLAEGFSSKVVTGPSDSSEEGEGNRHESGHQYTNRH